jgi:hypothetical protein
LPLLKLVFALSLLSFAALVQPAAEVRADHNERPALPQETCVFPFTPTTYESLKDRKLFLDTIELAAFNLLFPGDPYFGLPDVELGPRDNRTTEPGRVPPVLLKAIAYIESSITQGGASTPFGSIGPALIAFDCGHGITQVTSGMTVPIGESGRGSPEQALVATHYAYNIARGAYILVDKWNQAPEEKPIAGRDTLGHPALLENWYFAVWSYNGFTGPGANKSNHPMDPIYGTWPRTPYSCGPAEDGLGHNRANYPYQELVIGCASNPPSVDGELLWEAQPISLPDLKKRDVRRALALDTFVFPYDKMDIASPQPYHMDFTPMPDPELRSQILGEPQLEVSADGLEMSYMRDVGSSVQFIDVMNPGTGILAWYAMATVPWLTITPYTGVALGEDLPCEEDVPCERNGRMEIRVDTQNAPSEATNAQILVQGLGTPLSAIIEVELTPVVRAGLTAP